MQRPIEVLSEYRPHCGTLHSMLDSRAAAARSQILVFGETSLSYAAVQHQVSRAAALFVARGVKEATASVSCRPTIRRRSSR
jgi:non-ribosomal peptide synthetase component E (peptide arylation enzyme)